MARKVFISFLGTTDYVPCNYYIEGDNAKIVENLKYVQEAVIKLFCNEFNENDVAFFFLTDGARESNWNDTNGERANEGLCARLQSMNLVYRILDRRIEEGFSVEQIWSIFETIYKELQEGDEIYFDITHAFRSLPMLGMVLIDYAKALKNVTVKGIYYGAFEALGPAYKVREMPLINRNAAILNLIGLSNLQDWTGRKPNCRLGCFFTSHFGVDNIF